MMDSIALAKAIEIQCRAREEQWRQKEDLFYLDYGRDPWPFFTWIGRIFDAMRSYRNSIKKADRLEMGRSACDEDRCCDQAAC
jgi:hypothetical protein